MCTLRSCGIQRTSVIAPRSRSSLRFTARGRPSLCPSARTLALTSSVTMARDWRGFSARPVACEAGASASEPAARTDITRTQRSYVAATSARSTNSRSDSLLSTRSRGSTSSDGSKQRLLEDLAGLLMGQDLPLHPLERVVDRLRVAPEVLGHLLVRRAFEVMAQRVRLER